MRNLGSVATGVIFSAFTKFGAAVTGVCSDV